MPRRSSDDGCRLGPRAASFPVEERVTRSRVLALFDQLHQRQAHGSAALWGLIDETEALDTATSATTDRSTGRVYQLIPADCRTDWPSMGSSHAPALAGTHGHMPLTAGKMSAAFGPALIFWQGCASHGLVPSRARESRTDIAGLANYHTRESKVFERSIARRSESLRGTHQCRARVPKAEPVYESGRKADVLGAVPGAQELGSASKSAPGCGAADSKRSVTSSPATGNVGRYLPRDSYLQARWQSELRAAGRNSTGHRREGKTPDSQQFAPPPPKRPTLVRRRPLGPLHRHR